MNAVLRTRFPVSRKKCNSTPAEVSTGGVGAVVVTSVMMIDQVGEGNRPTIGEGVETTLAALQLGLSYKAANNVRPRTN